MHMKTGSDFQLQRAEMSGQDIVLRFRGEKIEESSFTTQQCANNITPKNGL
jgi:hypothetical protein